MKERKLCLKLSDVQQMPASVMGFDREDKALVFDLQPDLNYRQKGGCLSWGSHLEYKSSHFKEQAVDP